MAFECAENPEVDLKQTSKTGKCIMQLIIKLIQSFALISC
jgi:hypothetical protein